VTGYAVEALVAIAPVAVACFALWWGIRAATRAVAALSEPPDECER